MARQAFKDKNFRTIGYIDTDSTGRQKALDAGFRTLGYFDPKQNKTVDAGFRMIALGNVLSGLIYDKR